MVVDASVVIDYLLGAGRIVHVEKAELHAPQICDLELASMLGRLLRAGRLTERRAAESVASYTALPLRLHGHRPLLARCLALRTSFSAYDAAYIALAERLGAPLLTLDRRLERAARRHTDIEVIGLH